MSNIIVRIFGNLSTRIMFIFYLSIILITAFFIIFGYYSQLALQEERQYDKLKGIVTSAAEDFDGDGHQIMMANHPNKDDIYTGADDPIYNAFNRYLKSIVQKNQLNSPMYTMVYNPDSMYFEFGVNSNDSAYFRHVYDNYPQILMDSMEVGAVVPKYEDEHGTWISAFHPIKNSNGDVVAILQADTDFTEFIWMVRAEYLRESLIALGVIVALAFVLIPYTRKVLRQEEEQKRRLAIQSDMIEEKNRDITDSINYALKIQNSILPNLDEFVNDFADFGLLYKPKDIVAGDFYFLEKDQDNIYVAAADCTGHGVPGAMVSVICSNALSFAINERKLSKTNEILDAVREIVVDRFQGSTEGIKDGMDVSLCKIRLNGLKLEYSGANNPIYILRNNELLVLKPDKQPVGHFENAQPFGQQSEQLQKGDLIYLFTDGYADQFGGDRGKKLKYKPFREFLLSIQDLPLKQQMQKLDQHFENWKMDFEQVDDICIIGIRI